MKLYKLKNHWKTIHVELDAFIGTAANVKDRGTH